MEADSPKKPSDYREILTREFLKRNRANPRYSQHAFARLIGLGPSRLSEILSGKDGLSHARARSVAEKLRPGPEEARLFVDLAEARHARSRLAREAARARLAGLGDPATPPADSRAGQR